MPRRRKTKQDGSGAARRHAASFDADEETENEDTAQNTYQSIEGDDTEAEMFAAKKASRQLKRRRDSDSDSELSDDSSDDEQTAASILDDKKKIGSLTVDDLLKCKFDEAVCKSTKTRADKQPLQSRCWGCRHGISGSGESEQENLQGLSQFVRKHYGSMCEREFALECAKYHYKNVRAPIVETGGHCEIWSAESILKHFRQHTNDPHIRDMQRLDTLRRIGRDVRKRMKRVTLDENGEETIEINKQAVDLFLRVTDRETQLMRQQHQNRAAAGAK